MTITAAPTVKDRCLEVRGKVILTHVTGNIVVSPVVGTESAFLGATSTVSSSRHVFDLGILQVKIWWMIPPVGRSAKREESALEDEFSSDSEEPTTENTCYILLLPVLDGQFRTTLQGTQSNELQLCIERDAYVQASQSLEAAFVNSGDNPFELIRDSIKILEKHKGTFCHLENKRIPAHLDWFGWSTWDAFYTEVSPQGIKEGLQSFLNEGCSPKFIIIDDGWQETLNTFRKEGESVIEGTQFATRLIDIKENKKFTNAGSENSCNNLHDFVDSIKQNMNVKYVYMWHTLTGYWGGVLPSSDALKKYNPKILYPIQSPGTTGNLRDVAMDSLEKYGVGIIDPEKLYDFYNDSHSYLASCGVDGVKFKNSAAARASEDFMPREPTFQTLHIASVAFNSLLLLGESKHETAESHAAARSIGGCAVYVSDKPGNHDFKILKKLVLPDGSVLRARYAGHPTRDCLFEDPVMDGKSLLKICNLNVLTGVVGVFNCQGAGSLLSKVSCRGKLEVSLETLQCEIYTVSPIRVFGHDVQFAPIGLLDMYNSGGAIEALDCTMDVAQCVVKIKGRGCGRFGAYSNVRPKSCVVDMKEEEFSYIPEDGLLTITLGCEGNSRDMEFVY
uniref:galactinol--sucrose galactosyltransferase n=1 Tax=Glycine max TaxID=3847 RepID=A0A0R0JIG4_SOYBN